MLEDQTPFQHCLCSFIHVNIKVRERERESGLSILIKESDASLKGGRGLEPLL